MQSNHFLGRCARLLMPALAFLALAMPVGAFAQTDYPNRPVRIVLPFPAGGITDTMTRILAQELDKSLEQRFFVDNRAGASGIIGSDVVAKAAPDGYTICMCTSGLFTLFPSLGMKLPMDPLKDLMPVAHVYTLDLFFVVKADSPVRSLADLVARAKAAPDKVTYATSGIGGPLHLGAEALSQAAGIKMAHVPYKGEGLMLPDIVGGQLEVAIVSGQFADTHSRAGSVRVIASLGSGRNPLFPNVPTIQETYPGVVSTSWTGIFVPAGTPAPIRQKLHDATMQAVRGPMRDRLAALGIVPGASRSPAEFAAFIGSEADRWDKLIKAAGIKLEPNR